MLFHFVIDLVVNIIMVVSKFPSLQDESVDSLAAHAVSRIITDLPDTISQVKHHIIIQAFF